MAYTRRELLQKVFTPTRRAAAPDSEPTGPAGFPGPEDQDIVLREDLCIAWGRGICDRCDTACADKAILFVGMMHPRILPDRCTLCGDCVPICPTAAIVLRPVTENNPETGEST